VAVSSNAIAEISMDRGQDPFFPALQIGDENPAQPGEVPGLAFQKLPGHRTVK